ncbi:MAG: shikimate kinase [Actinomycetota bacterium]|nr:shikimate kinase [Actinomycetota bacterium]
MPGPANRPTHVLIGPPGAGKSTVGTLLAARLGVDFRDTDADVERTSGKTIAEIFYDEGEPGFRAREHQAVEEALATHRGVLSLGGGAVLNSHTRALLRGHHVVFLTVSLGEAANRVGLSRDRPVLALNPRATLRDLMAQRLPFYQALAGVTVDTTGREPDDVAADIARLSHNA